MNKLNCTVLMLALVAIGFSSCLKESDEDNKPSTNNTNNKDNTNNQNGQDEKDDKVPDTPTNSIDPVVVFNIDNNKDTKTVVVGSDFYVTISNADGANVSVLLDGEAVEPTNGKYMFTTTSTGNHSIKVSISANDKKVEKESSYNVIEGSYVETIKLNDGKEVKFKMIYVEGGTFMMGATDDDTYAWNDEKPAHEVTLDGYWIAETETTIQLNTAIEGYYNENTNPITRVTWEDCKKIIEKLNTLTNKKYRLPSEAEWEYAARGGNKSNGYMYSGSNNLDEVAWYEDNTLGPQPVAQKKANELGLYDMSGNCLEWCEDEYGYYDPSNTINLGDDNTTEYRVLRGGSIIMGTRDCRVRTRAFYERCENFDQLTIDGSDFGFRLAL